MSTQGLLIVAVCALLQAGSNLLLRQGVLLAAARRSADATFAHTALTWIQQPLFIFGVVMYGVTALLWFSVLAKVALSSAYPLLVGMTFALVVVGSVALFGEHVSIQKLVGICVILAGIMLVSWV